MKYTNRQITIKELVDLIDNGKMNLKPSYQRNDIWSKNDQGELIDSILNEYPLPNFFFYRKDNNTYEMVDGQQRSRTIYRFYKGQISSSKKTKKIFINESIRESFENYQLNIIDIEDVKDESVLQDFYVLVNKKGKHLNAAELNKAEYSSSNFLRLVETLVEAQLFISLDLFSDATKKRMNDRSFVEELVAYLHFGIIDKKIAVSKLFEKDITIVEREKLEKKVHLILEKINILNDESPINKTRYKQKNDFYTLFCFVNENLGEDIETLKSQYKVLVFLYELGVITPSNNECGLFKDYALNCVSQSNSKNARLSRLEFFNTILKSSERGKTICDIVSYLQEVDGREIVLKNVNNYLLIDTDNL